VIAGTERSLQGKDYIRTLDGWRAGAILGVVLYHALGPVGPVSAGRYGVQLFFAISGFLITARLIHEDRQKGSVSLKAFYIRRAFRILPPAFTFLLTILIASKLNLLHVPSSEILKAALFVRNYLSAGEASWQWQIEHFWSLCVEEHFYLLWPGMFVLFGVRRARWIAPVLALVSIVWRTADWHYNFAAKVLHAPALVHNGARSDYCADSLLWGCTLALVLYTPSFAGIYWNRKITTMLGWSAVIALSVVFLRNEMTGAAIIIALCMPLLILSSVTNPDSPLGRVLEIAPVRYVGRLSYSLYIWQQLFLMFRGGHAFIQTFPANIVLAFLFAAGSYYLVERPMIKIGHSLANGPRKVISAPVGELVAT
jgi:peptidoglycan/LPS O-acetylase OafA/YrhL